MESNVLAIVVAALSGLFGLFLSFSKLKASFQQEVDSRIKAEVANARSIAEGDLKAVDLKLDSLAKDIANLEQKVDRDIEHVKIIYNSEIRQLAEKIESLRDDVQKQHNQLVSILTKLVEK